MQNIYLVLVIIMVGVFLAWRFSRARRILESWAADNGFQIRSSQVRLFRLGPFLWRKSKGQVVYYVTVQLHDGTTRRGWVKCGSWWWGTFQNEAEVSWEE